MFKPIKFDSENIYFFGCFHGHHNKDFIYEKRGFSSIQEHDKVLMERWNNKITNNDTAFLLGDTMFGNGGMLGFLDLLANLNAKELYLMPGNHHSGFNALFEDVIAKGNNTLDIYGRITANYLQNKVLYLIPNYYEILVKNQLIVLSHYPIICHNRHARGSFMICSHVHGNLVDFLPSGKKGKTLDVGPESVKEPMSFSEVSKIMEEKPVWGESHHTKINNRPSSKQSPKPLISRYSFDGVNNPIFINRVPDVVSELQDTEDVITDGYQFFDRTCPVCNSESMEIVRPGKVQCCNCG